MTDATDSPLDERAAEIGDVVGWAAKWALVAVGLALLGGYVIGAATRGTPAGMEIGR